MLAAVGTRRLDGYQAAFPISLRITREKTFSNTLLYIPYLWIFLNPETHQCIQEEDLLL